MNDHRNYDILPRTFKARLLLATAFLAGVSVFAFWIAFYALATDGFGDLNPFGEVDVTVENRTDRQLVIYVEGQSEAVLPPGQTATINTFKIQWRFGGATVQAVDGNGIIVFQEDMDLGGLKDIGHHIVIEEPPGGFVTAPPCTASQRQDCLQRQTELDPIAQPSCLPREHLVCIAPLGQIDTELVRSLVKYYRDEYALDVGVLTPSSVPSAMTDSGRLQIDGASLSTYLGTRFPAEFQSPDVALIGLTPLDLYTEDRNWAYLLGHADRSSVVVSTYRMHLGETGLVDDEQVLSRTRKLFTYYLGLIVYDLPVSDDPTSPMYGNILSMTDLDDMEEPLPIPSR